MRMINVFVSSTQRTVAEESWRLGRTKPAKRRRRPAKVLVWFPLTAYCVGLSKPERRIDLGSAPYGRSVLSCPVRNCGKEALSSSTHSPGRSWLPILNDEDSKCDKPTSKL